MGPEKRGDDVEKKVKYDEREKERDVDRSWGAEFLIIPAVSKFNRADSRNHFRDQLLHFSGLTLKACVNRWHLTQYDR